MDYYNPFPPASAAKQSACLFSNAATLFYDTAQWGDQHNIERVTGSP